jgi:dynein heavy chain 1
VLAPYFKSVVHGKFRDKQESDKLIPTIEKNLNDAEVALLHLKQNIDIPDVELVVNPKIQEAVDRARANDVKANVADLRESVNDPTFLNALQAGVNRWTTDIQKVTKLDRNPESGVLNNVNNLIVLLQVHLCKKWLFGSIWRMLLKKSNSSVKVMVFD